MVWSCGMNGRSRESRPSGSGGQTSKKNLSIQNQRTAHKPKASAEAIQMARILEDPGRASEVNSKVASVLTVVPGCTEEQVHLALHDNNYDLDKAISALLDSDGVPDQGEWTTTTSTRKGRKKGTTTEDQSKTNTGRATSRSSASSSGTRESYGGSVTVSGGPGSAGRTGQRQTAGRGRGQSAGKRVRSGAGVGEQRKTRQRDKDKPHNTIQGPAAPNKASSEEWDSLPAVATTQQKEDDWGREGDVWQQAAFTEQVWEPVQQPAETGVQLQPREASLEQAQDTGLEQSRDICLEQPQSGILEETSDFGEPGFEEGTDERNEPNSVFPEAIPGGQALLHSTQSEITPTTLVSTGGAGERGQALTLIPSESREKVLSRKPRRLARSQIPTKPVEMPDGIESLDVQFGELGIDFVGLESQSPPPPERSSDATLSLSVSGGRGGDQLNTVDSQLTYSQLQHRYEDGSVSMSTSSSTAGGGGSGLGGGDAPSRALLQLEPSAYSESGGGMVPSEDVSSSGGGGLRSPPGLPHPVASVAPAVVSEASQYRSSTTTAGDSTIKDQTAGGVAMGGAGSSQQSPSEAQLHLRSDVNQSPTVKPTPMELPIELATRKSQPASQQTSTTPGPIEHTPFSSVTSSGSGKFSSSVTASTSVSSLSSSVSSRAVSAVSGHPSSSLSNQHHQHHQTQQQQGKLGGSSVPPGMLYPHMMPAQYPFIPAVNPAMYNYDPNDMSRYSSGSMAYFPTSTDPTMGGAIPSRDHTSSAFQAQTEQAKYAPPRGGASDLGSAVTVSSTPQSQQQQQGGNLQQAAAAAASGAQQMGPAYMGTPHFYGNMFYPAMYGPMPAFSQAANFGGFGSYEDMLAAAGGQASHDYSKMYAATANSLSKQPSSTSTAPIDSSAALAAQASTSFKHHDTNKQFSYSVPGGVGASQAPTAAPQYYMQMPFPPMMVGPGADVGGVAGGVAPHSRISQQKHSSKVGGGVGYQGNSGASYWGSTAAHSS